MKTGRKILCLYLSVALILMGCGPGFMVKQDENPVLTKGNPIITYGEPVVTRDEPVITWEEPVITWDAPVTTKDAPVVTREKTQDAKVAFLHRFQPRPEGYKKLGLSKNYTVFSAQERMKKEGGEWKGFINSERVITRNYGVKNGKRSLYGPGYLDPGYVFFAKFVKEDKDGNRLWRARFIGQCGNEIPEDDLMILETTVVFTEKTSVTERVTNTKQITKTKVVVNNIKTEVPKNTEVTNTLVYTNVDYEPALWAGLIGILIGLGLGYLFWFGSGATTVVASNGTVAGVPCPPGAPAPRPF